MSNYAREKLKNAIFSLTAREGDIEERLEHVFNYDISPLHAKDLPSDFRPEFEYIKRRVTAKAAEIPGEGTIRATIRSLDKSECEQLAQRLVSLALDVLSHA